MTPPKIFKPEDFTLIANDYTGSKSSSKAQAIFEKWYKNHQVGEWIENRDLYCVGVISSPENPETDGA